MGPAIREYRFWKKLADIEVPNDLLDLSFLPYLKNINKKGLQLKSFEKFIQKIGF